MQNKVQKRWNEIRNRQNRQPKYTEQDAEQTKREWEKTENAEQEPKYTEQEAEQMKQTEWKSKYTIALI